MQVQTMNKEEINILSNLKNIKSISSCVIPSSKKIIINCITKEGNLLSYSNKDKCFELFYNILIKNYKENKDEIDVIYDETKLLLEYGINKVYPRTYDGYYGFNKKINYPINHLESLRPLINEVLAIVLGLQNIEIENISNFKGKRDYFSLIIDTSLTKKIIPVKLKIINEFEYNITLGRIFYNMSITLNIDFTENYINISWEANGINFSGINRYEVLEDKVKVTNEVYFQDEIKVFNVNEVLPSNINDEEILKLLQNDELDNTYKYYILENGMIIASKRSLDNTIIDNNYISFYKNNIKNRNCYTEYALINNILCKIISTKRISDQFICSPNLSLLQANFEPSFSEESLYNDEMSLKTYYAIIKDGQIYPLNSNSEEKYIECIDKRALELCLERKVL